MASLIFSVSLWFLFLFLLGVFSRRIFNQETARSLFETARLMFWPPSALFSSEKHPQRARVWWILRAWLGLAIAIGILVAFSQSPRIYRRRH